MFTPKINLNNKNYPPLTLLFQETHKGLSFIQAAADFDIADSARIPTHAPPDGAAKFTKHFQCFVTLLKPTSLAKHRAN